jgi:hypothetical protein
MTASKPITLTDVELFDQFETQARVHGHNVVNGEAADANRSYWRLNAVREELRARGPRSRAGLARFFDHPEMAVRYYAATELLAVEPVRARAVIQNVKDRGPRPLVLDASMTLRMLDDGTFKPT